MLPRSVRAKVGIAISGHQPSATWHFGYDVGGRGTGTRPPAGVNFHTATLPAAMSSTLPDYYGFLDIPPTATAEEVRAAYRKESLKYVARVLFRVGLAHVYSTIGRIQTDS